MSDQSYTYHGNDDELSSWDATFTSRNGDGSGDSEERFHSTVKLAAACKAGGAFLDVGSGLGRIIEEIKSQAGTVTGLEPDPQRFLACKQGFSAERNIEVLNTTSWDYRSSHPRRKFDLATVSMVLQHVSTKNCQRILRDVREMIAPNGVAIFSTTHFFEERFTYEADLARHEMAEFDRYADHSESQDRGIPVRMFSKESFNREISQAGLEVIEWQQFCYVRPDKVGGVAAMYSVDADCVRDHGISQYAVVRRLAGAASRSGLLPRLRFRAAMSVGPLFGRRAD